MSNLTNADNVASFEEEVINSELPVVVDFWAAWCGPCRMVSPEVEAIAESHKDTLKVVKVDVDKNQEIAARYSIFSIPTIGLFKEGQLVAQSVGAKPRWALEKDLGL
ncbi:MAG: thioredoxin [Actinobacteria bacterium]|jgi:thioredoxin 1|nr:thioredoxin [Actinomycetota bacterium]MCL6105046.1 thioredoxin [Actinomycetota bacterium]